MCRVIRRLVCPIVILYPSDLIEGPLVGPFRAKDIEHGTDPSATRLINPVSVSVAISPQSDPGVDSQLIEVSGDPVFEFGLNNLPQGMILEVINV
jgi:hypothetical protein